MNTYATTDVQQSWAGAGQAGTRYAAAQVNTSAWAVTRGSNQPAMQAGDKFQIWYTPGGSAFPSLQPWDTNAIDLFKVNQLTANDGTYPTVTLTDPTVYTVQGLTYNAEGTTSTLYFTPVPTYSLNNSYGVVSLPRPTQPRYIGQIGHVNGLTYSYVYPGGCDQMTFNLAVEPDYRTDALNPGRIIQAFRGGSCVWEGELTEPVPTATGWQVTANGNSTYGTNYLAYYGTWNADDPVNKAINRGMRWVNPGIGSPSGIYLGPVQDPGSLAISDFMSLLTTGGALVWNLVPPAFSTIPAGPWVLQFSSSPMDLTGVVTSPATLLLASTTPVARTIQGTYNAQPLSSRVRLADGTWSTIGTLNPGDRVIDPYGEDSKVDGVYPKGVRPVYRVTLADGTSAEACDQHLWNVETVGKLGKPVRTLSTLDLKAAVEGKASGVYNGVRVVPSGPMNFDAQEDLPIDPYILGVLLSEGSLSVPGVAFTQDAANTDMLDRVRDSLPENHDLKSVTDSRGISTSTHAIRGDGSRKAGSNKVLEALRNLGLYGKRSWEKFIPEMYKRASLADRQALLQGLMDGDGCVHQTKRGRPVTTFTSSSEQLRDEVADLVRTLGGRCFTKTITGVTYTSPTQKTKKAARDAYKITSMNLPLNPFYMQRKAELFVPGNAFRARKVISVEYLREEEVSCISVSASSHLYITDNDIPTHNTMIIKYLVKPDTAATKSTAATAATYAWTFADIPSSVAKFGRQEYYIDCSTAGLSNSNASPAQITAAQAQAIGVNILSKFVNANWSGSYTVSPNQLMNIGGTPVDIGTNMCGQICQLACNDAPYGGQVTMGAVKFLIGGYSYDEDSITATVTPYQGTGTDMASLVAALYPGIA